MEGRGSPGMEECVDGDLAPFLGRGCHVLGQGFLNRSNLRVGLRRPLLILLLLFECILHGTLQV